MARTKGARNKPKGLGDTIEKVTEATGIKTVVEAVAKVTGKDCGCNKRKEFFNKKFPYINTEEKCMNEEQIEFYERIKNDYLSQNRSSVNIKGEDAEGIISLYNAIFRTNLKGCTSCQMNVYTDKIEKVYQNVKNQSRVA